MKNPLVFSILKERNKIQNMHFKFEEKPKEQVRLGFSRKILMNQKYLLLRGELGDNKLGTCLEWAKKHRYRFSVSYQWESMLPDTELLIVPDATLLSKERLEEIKGKRYKKVFFLVNGSLLGYPDAMLRKLADAELHHIRLIPS